MTSRDGPALDQIETEIATILANWEGSDEYAGECAARIVRAILRHDRLKDALGEIAHLGS